jgi:hypothetical protein
MAEIKSKVKKKDCTGRRIDASAVPEYVLDAIMDNISQRCGAETSDRLYEKMGDCWEHTKIKTKYPTVGYKTNTGERVTMKIHRLFYAVFMEGDGLEGQTIEHRCGNPHCVNPDHLELMTVSENSSAKYTRYRADAKYNVDAIKCVQAQLESTPTVNITQINFAEETLQRDKFQSFDDFGFD